MLDFVFLAKAPTHLTKGAIVMFDDWHCAGVEADIKDLEREGYITDVKWYRGFHRPGKKMRHPTLGYEPRYNDGLIPAKIGDTYRDKPWVTSRYTGKMYVRGDRMLPGPKGPTGAYFPYKQDVGL